MLTKVTFFSNFFEDIFKSVTTLSSLNFLDIFIIALLIYITIKLLRETHSISVVAGVLMLLGFYGLALLFDLPLTSLVLRSFFGVFLIIIAIIFQRELRRFFSTFGFLGVARRFMPPSEMVMKTVSHSVGRMASEKIGALIIFPGREQINRHLEGGNRLNGEISEPLLLSIFDKTSPGHDGATIIESNRIRKFAVHLPLAEQIEKVRHLGLRHRAALGLSERSDAFIIVVSEERGVISVVQNGKIMQMQDEAELRRRLLEFYKEKFPQLNLFNLSRWFVKNVLLLTISFIIALGIFSVVNSRFALVQRNFVVTPEFSNIPAEIIINDVSPQEVILTLKGRGSDFDVFKPESLRVLVDVGALFNITKAGWHRVSITDKEIESPFNLSVIKIDPLSIRVQIIKKDSSVPPVK
ncbi:MAG: hypothetical protein COS58_00910 [Candidatus Tagabacteria bacterium CG03_land_8_20_14_0_80_41_22]|uniref:Diadenylate cyclase n=1 Tax=Candidatus Tagabacteria bacterium CG03_land_8_20_14_0_80_41_22 TaxID=1975020 RepID=A0A2M7B9C0_9BACT|nr:MAG: hypothetical protein COS58_00910 [Candidatus Tagabacteria bacterium CG03_land_8_20_14_0_80_41_22]